MNAQQQHEMILEKTLPSGEEEWSCLRCGRRMIINWEPEFKRTLLETGDDDAIHSVSKGGLHIESLQVDAADAPAPQEDPQSVNEDPRLAPWLAWLEKVDFDSLWNDEA